MSSTIKFIVIVPHYWGRGETVDEALENLATAGGANRYPRKVYAYDERRVYNVHVAQINGSLRWTYKDESTPELDDPKLVIEQTGPPITEPEQYVMDEMKYSGDLAIFEAEEFAGDALLDYMLDQGRIVLTKRRYRLP